MLSTYGPVRRIAEVNFQIAALGYEPEVGFEHENMWITDPLSSSCSRFQVDPVAAYGGAFLASPFFADPQAALERAMSQYERVSQIHREESVHGRGQKHGQRRAPHRRG
jgi:hypothetical protein